MDRLSAVQRLDLGVGSGDAPGLAEMLEERFLLVTFPSTGTTLSVDLADEVAEGALAQLRADGEAVLSCGLSLDFVPVCLEARFRAGTSFGEGRLVRTAAH